MRRFLILARQWGGGGGGGGGQWHKMEKMENYPRVFPFSP